MDNAAPAIIPGRGADDLTIIIGGLDVRVEAANIIRTIDTAADAWTAVLDWTPGEDQALDRVLRPFSYPQASVYLGGQLAVNGALYGVAPSFGAHRCVELEGFSLTADAIDSSMLPPYEFNNVTLEQHAQALLKPFGIVAVFEADMGGKFDRITAEPSDTVFGHLAALAAQRGALITSTANGEMLFTRAKRGGSAGTITEGEAGALQWAARFEGRERFSAYRAYGHGPKARSKTVTATDATISRHRVMTFSSEDTTLGNIGVSAEWRKSKQIAKSFGFPLPVDSWWAPNGKLWAPNTLLTVVAPSLMLPDGFTFLVRAVEFSYAASGTAATLSLVPPGCYSDEGETDPWAK